MPVLTNPRYEPFDIDIRKLFAEAGLDYDDAARQSYALAIKCLKWQVDKLEEGDLTAARMIKGYMKDYFIPILKRQWAVDRAKADMEAALAEVTGRP